MIAYLLKTVICSGILWCVYCLFLESSPMHRGKRVYLLLSLVYALLIPAITTPFGFPFSEILVHSQPHPTTAPRITPAIDNTTEGVLNDLVSVATTSFSSSATDSWPTVAFVVYALVTSVFVFRFVRNLMTMFRMVKTNPNIKQGRIHFVLLNHACTPFSFFSYIFVHRESFMAGNIDPAIRSHELAHVYQRHSYDIFIVELLQIIWWFNPFLPAIRRAIRLNHEFLADHAVIRELDDPSAYQSLLLQHIETTMPTTLGSAFNYSILKKRLIMMTRNTSSSKAWIGVSASVALCLTLPLFLGNTVAIRQASDSPTVVPIQEEFKPGTGATPTQFSEYKRVVDHITVLDTLNGAIIVKPIDYSSLKFRSAGQHLLPDDPGPTGTGDAHSRHPGQRPPCQAPTLASTA